MYYNENKWVFTIEPKFASKFTIGPIVDPYMNFLNTVLHRLQYPRPIFIPNFGAWRRKSLSFHVEWP